MGRNHLGRSCSTSSWSPHLLWVSSLVPVPSSAGLTFRSEPGSTASCHRRTPQRSGCTDGEPNMFQVSGSRFTGFYLVEILKTECISQEKKPISTHQRVFDGKVVRFLCFALQSFDKLEIFWILRLHVGQHLHTLCGGREAGL